MGRNEARQHGDSRQEQRHAAEAQRIGRRDANQERREQIDGINATVKLSPYDIPIALRARHGKESEALIIDFQYLQPDEPTENITIDKNILFVCGKHSKRVYSIEINDALKRSRGAAQVEGSFDRALSTFLNRKKDSPKSGSYQAAKEAMSLTWSQVFPTDLKLLATG